MKHPTTSRGASFPVFIAPRARSGLGLLAWRRPGLGRLDGKGLAALAITALGLALRLEHAATFDGPGHGSDYGAHMAGVRWMLEHWRPFWFTSEVPWSIGYQPPLWYALGALLLRLTQHERAIAGVAVAGWLVRQVLLARFLRRAAIPRWSGLAAVAVHAVLPVGVLTDGKVNPEGLHTTLFTAAVYLLWRMERQAVRLEGGMSLRLAALFGAFAGLAVLTKATAGVLPLAAAIVVLWHVVRAHRARAGWPAIWRRLVRPLALAGAVWIAVAGWWCGPNLVRYGHPFPHIWDRETPESQPILAKPALYRRPLGWALPFHWSGYLASPIIQSEEVPRPNLWAVLVTGTWSDWYNRGVCRLKGGGVHAEFWGGGGWAVSGRCLRLFSLLACTGCFITLAALAALARALVRHHRSAGRAGSLALPLVVVLSVLFTSLFALVYPFDVAAVLNPRYLLPVSTAMAACLGLELTELEGGGRARWRRIVRAALFVAITLVGVLVVHARWGD
jgi:4-amino-4-deoxy-L-arabinose transferase-like glycosyltransferase